MNVYPVGLNLTDKRVLVVGGGAVALRKVRGLVRAEARVDVVTPAVSPGLKRLASAGKIRIRRSAFRPGQVKQAHALVFSCANDPAVNREVAAAARRMRIWTNVADDAGAGVHLPAVSRRGPLTVALFSGGRAPAFVRQLRRQIDAVIGPQAVRRLRTVEEMRSILKRAVSGPRARRAVLRRLVTSPDLDRISRAAAGRRRGLLRRFAGLQETSR